MAIPFADPILPGPTAPPPLPGQPALRGDVPGWEAPWRPYSGAAVHGAYAELAGLAVRLTWSSSWAAYLRLCCSSPDRFPPPQLSVWARIQPRR